MKWDKVLNPVQLDAVKHTEGALLILAGAGSGKTRVLTHRVAYLLKEKRVNPSSILAITFTNKAAGEMRDRVQALVGPIGWRVWIGTFHATCARILRREIDRLGYKKNFLIYDDGDKQRLLKLVLKDLNLDAKRYPPLSLAAEISAAKNELIDADTYQSQQKTYFQQRVAEIYHYYQQKLFENSALDFDDLIMVTIQLFTLFSGVLDAYQERFMYILVDEYQDTNHAQYKLVNMLAERHRNLCVVGDDDQSIYRFRGADLRNILEFERDFPEARIVRLEQNYRSTKNILSAANEVISHNQGRKTKTLWTTNPPGELIRTFQAENEHDEAVFAAAEIERLRVAEKRSYRDFTLFYRTNAQSRVFEEAFLRHGVPYKIVGGVKFYERQEIKDVLAYLRVIDQPEDALSLRRILNVPRRGLGKVSLENLTRFATRENISLWESLLQAEANPWLSPQAKKATVSFATMITKLAEVDRGNLRRLLEKVLEQTSYVAALEKERTVEAEGRIENVKELLSVVSEFQKERGTGLTEFLEEISLIADIDTYNEEGEAVTLMTLHNAKGLEFPVVFIVGVEEGIFPHFRSLGDSQNLEEERRLCYVGVTRAKERLYLSYALSRNLWGSINYHIQSRFLQEIPDELTARTGQARSGEKGGSSRSPGPRHEESHIVFAVGDEVLHKTFGRGRVTATKGSDQITVAFGEGEKILHTGYAPLEKLQDGHHPPN